MIGSNVRWWAQPNMTVDLMMTDLRFAFRQSLKSPGFILLASIALALEIGLNTAAHAAPESAITAQDLLQRWAEAIGGMKKLGAVQNIYTKFSYRGTAGTGTIEEWFTSQGHRRQSNDLTTGHVINVVNGPKGWISNDGRVRELSPTELEGARTPAYIGSYSHLVPGRLPGRAEFLGEADSNYVLRVIPERGRPSTFYLDKTTYLPSKYEEQLTNTLLIIRFRSWRAVGGIKLPGELHMTTSDGGYEATASLQETKFNIRLADELFNRPPEGPKDFRFAKGQSSKRIPIEEVDGHFFFRGQINNSPPVWFGLDTAASHSLVDVGLARKLALKLVGNQQVTGAGGAVGGSYAKGVTIKLGDAELQEQTLSSLPLDPLYASIGREVPVLLGYDFLSRFVVEIDYAARCIVLHEPATFTYSGPGEVIPITLHNNQPYVSARLLLAERDPIAGEFVIDTGSGNSLMLSHAFATEHRVLDSVGKRVQSRARGVGGEIQLIASRIEGLRLGAFTIENPVTLFPQGEITAAGMAGNIGGKFLRRFRVIFDYSRNRVVLEPNKCSSEMEDYDMSGAALVASSPDLKLIKVSRVLENSPASNAGLMPEDIIQAVDNKSASVIGLASMREMFKKEGREYLLKIQRGEKTTQLKIKLQRLI